jgi:hypothetical protein
MQQKRYSHIGKICIDNFGHYYHTGAAMVPETMLKTLYPKQQKQLAKIAKTNVTNTYA